MKAIKLLIVVGFALSIFISPNPSGADLVTSLPGGTVIPMPAVNYMGPGPQTFGPGITWSSSTQSSDFGYNGRYNFALNGYWDGSLGPMAGLNDSPDFHDTMTFAFSTPVKGVGGFMNYALGLPGQINPPTIAVYDSSNTLIDSYTLTFNAGDGANTGFFYGFQEASNTISYFRLSGAAIAITNFTTDPFPLPPQVPLPPHRPAVGLRSSEPGGMEEVQEELVRPYL